MYILLCFFIGTTIISDKWSAYKNLGGSGYTHFTVNHSKNFIDPVTGAHTNTIESTWFAIKRTLSLTGRKKSNFEGYLATYMWRKCHSDINHNHQYSLFEQFLDEIARVCKPH